MGNISKIWQKFLLAYSILIRPSKVFALPFHIQVESTNACNLKSVSCTHDVLYPKSTSMSLDQFKRVMKQIRPQRVNISGIGEPFLNKEIFDMIKTAKSYGATVNCTTNFTRIKEGMLEKMIESGLDQIKVSIDASNKESFMLVRPDFNPKSKRQLGYYDDILENIRQLNRLKEEKKVSWPIVRLNFALQATNYRETSEVVKMAYDLKAAAVYIQYLEYINREERRDFLVNGIDKGNLYQELKRAEGVAKKFGIQTNLMTWWKNFDLYVNKMEPLEKFKPNQKPCYFPWVSSWVDADGEVRICPIVVWDKEAARMGNVFEKPFKEIWNSEYYQYIRRELRKGNRPTKPCETCIPPDLGDMLNIHSNLLSRKN